MLPVESFVGQRYADMARFFSPSPSGGPQEGLIYLSPNVEIIRSGQGQNLSYVLWSESSEGMVVDPSFVAEEIWRIVREKGITLKYIVNTHAHLDHSKGNSWLAEVSGAKVAIHLKDAPMLRDPPDMFLRDGDILQIGEVDVRIIHTPGHTPGGICLLSENELFTGDTLFVSNCGRTDLMGGSDEELFRSLQKLKELDGKTKIHPGHSYWGDGSTIEVERKSNPAMMSRTLEEFKLVP